MIEKLDNVPNLPAIEYLNLRGNKIEDEKEFGKLSHLSKLEKLEEDIKEIKNNFLLSGLNCGFVTE